MSKALQVFEKQLAEKRITMSDVSDWKDPNILQRLKNSQSNSCHVILGKKAFMARTSSCNWR